MFARPARSCFAELPTLRLHYLDWPGEAPPVVLLHPNRTNSRVWDFAVEYSRLENRFIAPDARGHGLSDYPERGYLYDDYIGDLEALFARLGLERIHLVGAATGGNIALLLATRRPGLVASLTVIDPGLSLDPALSARVREQMVREFRFASLDEARERMPFSDRWSAEMREHFSRHGFAIAADGTASWRYHPPGVVETEHSLETPIWDRIAVRCPTLILRGTHSAVFDAAKSARLAGIIPGARTAEIDADHRVSQDNPRALAGALDAFVADSQR